MGCCGFVFCFDCVRSVCGCEVLVDFFLVDDILESADVVWMLILVVEIVRVFLDVEFEDWSVGVLCDFDYEWIVLVGC